MAMGWRPLSAAPPQHGFHHMGLHQCLKHCLGQGCRLESQGWDCWGCVVLCWGHQKTWVSQGRESRFLKQYQSFRKLPGLCHMWASSGGYSGEVKMILSPGRSEVPNI